MHMQTLPKMETIIALCAEETKNIVFLNMIKNILNYHWLIKKSVEKDKNYKFVIEKHYVFSLFTPEDIFIFRNAASSLLFRKQF